MCVGDMIQINIHTYVDTLPNIYTPTCVYKVSTVTYPTLYILDKTWGSCNEIDLGNQKWDLYLSGEVNSYLCGSMPEYTRYHVFSLWTSDDIWK